MSDLKDLDIKQYDFVSSNKEKKVLAIRELPSGAVLDVRAIVIIDEMHGSGNGDHFVVCLTNGMYRTIWADEKYRQKLIKYWRYFNGV